MCAGDMATQRADDVGAAQAATAESAVAAVGAREAQEAADAARGWRPLAVQDTPLASIDGVLEVWALGSAPTPVPPESAAERGRVVWLRAAGHSARPPEAPDRAQVHVAWDGAREDCLTTWACDRLRRGWAAAAGGAGGLATAEDDGLLIGLWGRVRSAAVAAGASTVVCSAEWRRELLPGCSVGRLAEVCVAAAVSRRGRPVGAAADGRPLRVLVAPTADELVPVPGRPPVAGSSGRGPYSRRVCVDEPYVGCRRCAEADRIEAALGIDEHASLPDLWRFAQELRASPRWSWHQQRCDVWRVPEESVPAAGTEGREGPGDLADLRAEAQSFFDKVADEPPSGRPAARSPLYGYDEDGNLLPPWPAEAAPTTKVRTFTRQGLERVTLYRELLEDFVRGDARLAADESEVEASVLAFVTYNPSSGKPRACMAAHEANEAAGDASVKYGTSACLLAPGAEAGARGDLRRGFKHHGLSPEFGRRVAAIVDGVPVVPQSLFFGLNHGPRIFVSTLAVDLEAAEQSVGERVGGMPLSPLSAYVDDLGRGGGPRAVVLAMLALAVFLHARGWLLAVDKWFMRPAALMKFLGQLVDFLAAAVAVAPATVRKLLAYVRALLRASVVDAGAAITPAVERLLQRVTGLLGWCATVVPRLDAGRALLDRSIATGVWQEGAAALLLRIVDEAGEWPERRARRVPGPRCAFVASDGSLVVEAGQPPWASGGALMWSAERPVQMHTWDLSADARRVLTAGGKLSSTWAEARAARLAVGSLVGNCGWWQTVDTVVLATDSADMAAGAARGRSASATVDAEYDAIHRMVTAAVPPRALLTAWERRSALLQRRADAVSDAAVASWRPAPRVVEWVRAMYPPGFELDLAADAVSALAPRYCAQSPQMKPERLTLLAQMVRELTERPADGSGRVQVADDARQGTGPGPAGGAGPQSAAQERRVWGAAALAAAPEALPADAGVCHEGYVGPLSAARLGGVAAFLSLPPAEYRLLPSLADRIVAAHDDGCFVAVLAVATPDLLRDVWAWWQAGVFHDIEVRRRPDDGARRDDAPWVAPDGARPTFADHPTVLLGLRRRAREGTRPWTLAGGDAQLQSHQGDRVASALELFMQWVRGGRCPGDGPGTPQERDGRPRPMPRMPQPPGAGASTLMAAARVSGRAREAAGDSRAGSSALWGAVVAQAADPSSSAMAAAAGRGPAGAASGAGGPRAPVGGHPRKWRARPSRSEAATQTEMAVLGRALAGAAGMPAGSAARAKAAGAGAAGGGAGGAGDAARALGGGAGAAGGAARASDEPEHWVDRDFRCGQCHATIGKDDGAFICESPDCEGWGVCEVCWGDHPAAAVVYCPRCQLARWQDPTRVEGGVSVALRHPAATLGRMLGVLTAIADGAPVARTLRLAPLLVDAEGAGPDAFVRLRDAAGDAKDVAFDDARRKRIKGVSFRLLWLAGELEALRAPIRFTSMLAAAYVRGRLSSDRPAGWQRAGAAHVASELSAVAQALRDLGDVEVGAHCGAKAVLASRGAFEARPHSRRLPLTPFEILRRTDALMRSCRDADLLAAAKALRWHTFWGCRPYYLFKMEKRCFKRMNEGFVFFWRTVTKARRGDRAAGAAARLATPQVTAARHAVLTEIWDSCPDRGPMFPGVKPHMSKLVRALFGEDAEVGPDGEFTLAHAAVRNGLDVTLRVLFNSPGRWDDYIDHHLWWARKPAHGMQGYYAGLRLAIIMAATELAPEVRTSHIAPGWFDVVSAPRRPDWDALLPLMGIDQATCEKEAVVIEGDSDDSDTGLVPVQAPPGVRGAPPRAAARRRRAAR